MNKGKLGRCLVIANSAENLMRYHQILSKSFTTQTSSTFDSTFDLIDDFEPEVIVIDEKIIDSSAIEISNGIRNDKVSNSYFGIIIIASEDCRDRAQLQELTRADFVLSHENVDASLVRFCLIALRIKRLEDRASGLDTKLASSQETVRELESQDSITRLYNLPHMNSLLETEFQRAIRFDTPLVVLLVSIDSFKDISHREGPKVCIKIIQQLGADLKMQLRTEDFWAEVGAVSFYASCRRPTTQVHWSSLIGSKNALLTKSMV